MQCILLIFSQWGGPLHYIQYNWNKMFIKNNNQLASKDCEMEWISAVFFNWFRFVTNECGSTVTTGSPEFLNWFRFVTNECGSTVTTGSPEFLNWFRFVTNECGSTVTTGSPEFLNWFRFVTNECGSTCKGMTPQVLSLFCNEYLSIHGLGESSKFPKSWT